MPTSHRARLLSVAHQLLIELNPGDAEAFTLTLSTAGGTVVRLTSSGEFAPEFAGLGDQERAVVLALFDGATRSVEQIATLTGYTENSRLRAVLGDLQMKGHVENCDGGGYRRRPAPRTPVLPPVPPKNGRPRCVVPNCGAKVEQLTA